MEQIRIQPSPLQPRPAQRSPNLPSGAQTCPAKHSSRILLLDLGSTLESQSLCLEPAEAGDCGKCPPLTITAPCKEHSRDPGDQAAISTDGYMEDQDSGMYELPLLGEGCRSFQIFPDPVEVEVVVTLEGPEAQVQQGKERLPSIVVETVDVSEVESGELRWPPELGNPEEDEDLFLEQDTLPTSFAAWGEEEQGGGDEEDEVGRGEEEECFIIGNDQKITPLLDLLQSDYSEDTPSLSPESTSALN